MILSPKTKNGLVENGFSLIAVIHVLCIKRQQNPFLLEVDRVVNQSSEKLELKKKACKKFLELEVLN